MKQWLVRRGLLATVPVAAPRGVRCGRLLVRTERCPHPSGADKAERELGRAHQPATRGVADCHGAHAFGAPLAVHAHHARGKTRHHGQGPDEHRYPARPNEARPQLAAGVHHALAGQTRSARRAACGGAARRGRNISSSRAITHSPAEVSAKLKPSTRSVRRRLIYRKPRKASCAFKPTAARLASSSRPWAAKLASRSRPRTASSTTPVRRPAVATWCCASAVKRSKTSSSWTQSPSKPSSTTA